MKKLLLSLLGLLSLSIGANAQLRVLSNGHVQLGEWNPSPFTLVTPDNQYAPNSAIDAFTTQVNDTTTIVSVLGPNNKNFSGATLSFGGRKDVMIQEKLITI